MFEKFDQMDVRILYVIMAIAATFPLLKPIGLPLPISQQAIDSHAMVDSIQPGDFVLFGIDFGPSQEAELWPQTLAVGRHVAERGGRIVFLNMITGGFRYEERVESALIEQYELEYGKDIVSLPFVAGREAAFQTLVQDMKGLYKVDLHGNSLDSLPLWKDISGIKDFKYYIEIADAPDWWMRPISSAPHLKLFNGTVASGASTMAPFYQAKQLEGFIIGMSGGAEYEALIGQVGSAAAAMDGQSLGHGLIILFVILGNIGYMQLRRKELAAEAAKKSGGR